MNSEILVSQISVISLDKMEYLQILVFFSGVLLAHGQQQSTISCKPKSVDGGILFEHDQNQRWYIFMHREDMRLTYDDARRYCQEELGRLVNVPDKNMQDFIDLKLSSQATYRPPPGYDHRNRNTWGSYDPHVWFGATMDADRTWKFDRYLTLNTGTEAFILTWFNWNDTKTEQDVKDSNTILEDACMTGLLTITVQRGLEYWSYPWTYQKSCSSGTSPKHPYICEYESYTCVETSMSKWLVVIVVLSCFVACGFLSCIIYCLWDKIHTSYNVLQV